MDLDTEGQQQQQLDELEGAPGGEGEDGSVSKDLLQLDLLEESDNAATAAVPELEVEEATGHMTKMERREVDEATGWRRPASSGGGERRTPTPDLTTKSEAEEFRLLTRERLQLIRREIKERGAR